MSGREGNIIYIYFFKKKYYLKNILIFYLKNTGIVDTAVKTAETGYLGRRLAKGFESVKTHYGDCSVRNAFGEIIQFNYGNDSYDPMWLERFNFTLEIHLSRSSKYIERYTTFVQFHFKKKPSDNLHIPCDPLRLCLQAMDRSEELSNSMDDYDFLMEGILDSLGGPNCIQTAMYQAVIAHVLHKDHFYKLVPLPRARRWVFLQLLDRHSRALVSPGEMVGIIAAQSIAQPATQLTLNTFHYAGVAAFNNITLGLPRLKELTDATAESITPSMIIPILSGIDPILAKRSIQSCVLQNFITSISHTEISVFPHTEISVCILLDMVLCVDCHISPSLVFSEIQKYFQNILKIFEKIENLCCSLPNEPLWKITFNMNSNVFDSMDFYNIIKQIRLTGIEKLDSLSNVQIHTSAAVSKYTPFVVDASPNALMVSGSCLEHTLGLLPDLFDFNAIYSNNLHEINACLGIEAAAAMLFSELRLVLSVEGTFVHDRHFQLIVDVMTHSGSIVPLSRHGLNKNMNTGILARASFEATVDQLLEVIIYIYI
jgi:DNA-directed RNA polymerase beta' subunit